jgi:DNA repair exonuclease SbcCD ATPase subunit
MIGTYRAKLERKKGHKQSLITLHNNKVEEMEQIENTAIDVEEATAFIQEVARKTQDQLKVHIEDIVTMALEHILDDDPYSFAMDFVLRRNKTECDLYFMRNGKRVHPVDASGGGAVDIASFACRIALWSLQPSNNVIVFDEPFRFVSKGYTDKVAEFLHDISEKLGIQIIMATHNDTYIKKADKICTVQKEHGKAYIKEEL